MLTSPLCANFVSGCIGLTDFPYQACSAPRRSSEGNVSTRLVLTPAGLRPGECLQGRCARSDIHSRSCVGRVVAFGSELAIQDRSDHGLLVWVEQSILARVSAQGRFGWPPVGGTHVKSQIGIPPHTTSSSDCNILIERFPLSSGTISDFIRGMSEQTAPEAPGGDKIGTGCGARKPGG